MLQDMTGAIIASVIMYDMKENPASCPSSVAMKGLHLVDSHIAQTNGFSWMWLRNWKIGWKIE